MAGVSWWSKLVNKVVNYKGDWLRDNRGSLMTVAALIATITFQPAIAPPGGVWQNHTTPKYVNGTAISTAPNSDEDCFGDTNTGCFAGTAIQAYFHIFLLFIVFDTVSFTASLVVLFLQVIGFPYKNKLGLWILTITVCISISSLGLTFVLGIFLVLPGDIFISHVDIKYSSVFSYGYLVVAGALFIFVIVLLQLIKFFAQRYRSEKELISRLMRSISRPAGQLKLQHSALSLVSSEE